MRGKQGFIRILEAFIAIMIISAALAFVYINQFGNSDDEEAIRLLIRVILEDIERDPGLRNDILDGVPYNEVSSRIDSLVPPEFEHDFEICDLNDVCISSEPPQGATVYSDAISVSSTLDQGFNPKVVRIFLWEDE
jgi:hypothetical protein